MKVERFDELLRFEQIDITICNVQIRFNKRRSAVGFTPKSCTVTHRVVVKFEY